MDLERVDRAASASASAQRRLRGVLVGQVERVWDSGRGVTDVDLAAWLESVTPLVEGAQVQAAELTAASLSEMLEALDVAPSVEIPAVSVEAVRGTPASEVYSRPVVQTRALLSQGVEPQVAVGRGRVRAVKLAVTDLQLARTRTAQSVLSATPGVVGYRRVLTGAESCGLCAVASTRRYRKSELMPIHPGCDCGVAPIVGTADPGVVINEPLRAALSDAVETEFGDRARRSYRQMIAEFDHGEYGPTLANASHHRMGRREALSR